MKKSVFFVFLAIIVLFTINTASADDNIPAAIRGIDNVRPLTDEECQEITSGPIIPSDAQKVIIKVGSEKEELMLPPNDYWIVGKERKFQALYLEKTTFIPLSRGSYVLYIAPKKLSPAMEIMRRRAFQQP